MHRLLKYALPSALGLMFAAPAMAQNGSNNGQSWNNSPQAELAGLKRLARRPVKRQ